ncbi:thrombomodulin [Heterodontus francisci]|uniref:thrombomodulin n=1 Tax=Heterodontus francisci TaxID=7792 RepID=UPI00355C1423
MLSRWMFLVSLVALVQSVRSSPQETAPAVCVATVCYSLQLHSRKFNMARTVCKTKGGDAMTVRSTVAADAISVLLRAEGVPRGGRFWIGLQLHQKTCPQNGTHLRGYRWVQGDAESDYSDWQAVTPACGPRCVTVSGSGGWTDGRCNEKADGVLCEYRYPGSCSPLALTNGSVIYITPFGTNSSELSVLPTRTVAVTEPWALRFQCAAEEDGSWAWHPQQPAPWHCQVENGGCQYSCQSPGGPRCSCPPGHKLNPNGHSCDPVDPCLEAHCQHHCLVQDGSPFCMCQDGYQLQADAKGCDDVDECLQNPCDQICINTPGSFSCRCRSGYHLGEDNKCEDINECVGPFKMCAHKCANTAGSFHCKCYSGYQVDASDFTRCIFHCKTNTGRCDPRCSGDECECPEGYIFDDELRQCFDIDECNSGLCDQDCTNSFGSFKCDCQEGYQLQADGTSCDREGSGSSETFNLLPTTLRPTSGPPHPARAGLSLGVVLGIIFAIAMLTLIFAGLGHHLLAKRGKWQTSTAYKPANLEQDVNLSQVTSTEEHKQQAQYAEKCNVGT